MQEQFHWSIPDSDDEIVLPHMNKIKGGVLRKHRKLEAVDFMFTILEDVADADTLAKVDQLDTEHMNQLFADWQKAGADLGKFSGSST